MLLQVKHYMLFLFVCCALNSSAQHTYNKNNSLTLQEYQDSLKIISEAAFAAKDDSTRILKNTTFVKEFVQALKLKDSFRFGFDSLKRITILKSPDNSFRIITWFLPLIDGSYRYYGTLQMATPDGSLKLFPLNDATSSLSDLNAITSNKNWYGARYYEMIPTATNARQPYFILLGWKGNNLKTSKKVIEVLTFDKGEPLFGKNIFETGKNKPLKNRIVFEYNKLNTMTLSFDKKVNMIVFDHLVPYDPKMIGNFEYYGSDLTFDAYKLTGDKLTLHENVELRNDASPNDNFYEAPVKASTLINKSGQ